MPRATHDGDRSAVDDAFVATFDAKGKSGWSHGFGTAAVDRATAIAVNASGVYVAGAHARGRFGD